VGLAVSDASSPHWISSSCGADRPLGRVHRRRDCASAPGRARVGTDAVRRARGQTNAAVAPPTWRRQVELVIPDRGSARSRQGRPSLGAGADAVRPCSKNVVNDARASSAGAGATAPKVTVDSMAYHMDSVSDFTPRRTDRVLAVGPAVGGRGRGHRFSCQS
jgi:hypothetical protein